MTQQPVLLQLPDKLYERIREVAANSNRPVENVLLDSLALLFGDWPDETPLESLQAFTDEQLWAIVYLRLGKPDDERLNMLIDLSKRGELTQAEEAEMERLLDTEDRYILLRSQALVLLKQRGHDVESRLNSGA
jgi:hypothetical protein